MRSAWYYTLVGRRSMAPGVSCRWYWAGAILARLRHAVWLLFFFSSRRRHTRLQGDWSSDVCSSDLNRAGRAERARNARRVRILIGIERVAAPTAARRRCRIGLLLHHVRLRRIGLLLRIALRLRVALRLRRISLR